MKFPNNRQLNLILDIVLDLIVECYILWNMKILLMIKLGLAIKKILKVDGFNLLDYFSSGNDLLMEYAERKLYALRKKNAMMKKYLDNKADLDLTLKLSKKFKNKNEYEIEFAKRFKSHKKESEKENTEEKKRFK